MSSPIAAIQDLVSGNLEKIAVRSRALVLLAGIAAVVALGLAFTSDEVVRVGGLAVFLVLMFMITVLVYLTSRATTSGDETLDHASLRDALGLVNGRWWQLVLSEETPGLTVVDVEFSVLPNRHHLSGTKYSPDGHEIATWNSRAVALMEIEPVQVFYYWDGQSRVETSLEPSRG